MHRTRQLGQKEDTWALPLYIPKEKLPFPQKWPRLTLHTSFLWWPCLEDPLNHSTIHLIRNGSLMYIICSRNYPGMQAQDFLQAHLIEAISKVLGPISRMQVSCMIDLRHPKNDTSAGRGKEARTNLVIRLMMAGNISDPIQWPDPLSSCY